MTFSNPMSKNERFLPAYHPNFGWFYQNLDDCEYWSCEKPTNCIVFENDTPSKIHLRVTQGDGHMMNLCHRHAGDAEKEEVNRCTTGHCFNIKQSKYEKCFECSANKSKAKYTRYIHEASPIREAQDEGLFHVYVLGLSDKTFYVGHTSDLRMRMGEHKSGKAMDTAGKQPQLVWFAETSTRKSASTLEAEIKKLRDKNDRKLRRMVIDFSDLVKETYWYKHS